MKKTFQITDNKGFHITFPNGLTLSTQFGPGNYCENRDEPFDFDNKSRGYSSSNCEFAIYANNENRTWKTKEFTLDEDGEDGDDVVGYASFDQWLKAFDWCKNYKPEEKEMPTPEQTKQALAEAAKPEGLKDLIEMNAKELARALPEHMKPERIVRIALTCIRLNPDLAKCSPQSFLGALFTSAQLGIEPIAGKAYLLPFNNSRKKPDGTWHTVKECQFILGYKGLVDLFYRHEKAINLDWGIVYPHDVFEAEKGTNPILRHKQLPRNSTDRPVGYWVMANLINGGKPFHYMTVDECLDHGRKHSKTYNQKAGAWYDNSPWVKEQDSMCLKTVLVQLAKILPTSVELQRALDTDESARDIRPHVDDVLDLPNEVNWDQVEKEVEKKTEEILDNEKKVS